jgi:hypothetical protein
MPGRCAAAGPPRFGLTFQNFQVGVPQKYAERWTFSGRKLLIEG